MERESEEVNKITETDKRSGFLRELNGPGWAGIKRKWWAGGSI
jgi:hypothetical protein